MADIAVCSECAGEMDVSAAAPFNRVACPNCGEEVRVKVDFGNYLLQSRLAFGGMSILFVALDQTLGREVALKVLNEEYSSDEFRTAQFEKEAELTALVSHPNVVRVYSVGRAFERFYIAMELISGESLEKRLETGEGMPEREVLEIALQVAAGLKAAKSSGLIHRDIKPGNILVDEDGVAKIVDFGLSLVTQAGSAQAEEIFATPYYAPPEALEAKVEDFRSDIYALGASLYHALAGKPPIESTSTNTKTLLDAKKRVPPLRKVAPQVSASTEALVSKMMAFEKEHRWTSYDEVSAGLTRALKGESQSAPEAAPRRRRKSSSGKGIVIGFVGLLLLVGGFVVVKQLQQGGKEKLEEVVTSPDPEVIEEGPSEAMMIAKTYQRARNAMQNGKLREAEFNYLKLFREKDTQEPTRSWSGLEAGLCALLDGRPGDARLVFRKLKNRLNEAELDPETKNLFEELLRDWDQLKPMPIPQQCSSEPDIAMMEFTKALGNWEKGERELEGFFESMANQEFSDKKEWLSGYQKWALKLGEDLRLLEEKEPDWKKVWSPSELKAEISRLDQLEKKLQTSGRAVFMVRSWRQWLSGKEARRNEPNWES